MLNIYDTETLKTLVLTLMDKFPGRTIRFNDSVSYQGASSVEYAMTIHLRYREYHDNEGFIRRLLSQYEQPMHGHTFKYDDLYIVGIEQASRRTIPNDVIAIIDAFIGKYVRTKGACPTK